MRRAGQGLWVAEHYLLVIQTPLESENDRASTLGKSDERVHAHRVPDTADRTITCNRATLQRPPMPPNAPHIDQGKVTEMIRHRWHRPVRTHQPSPLKSTGREVHTAHHQSHDCPAAFSTEHEPRQNDMTAGFAWSEVLLSDCGCAIVLPTLHLVRAVRYLVLQHTLLMICRYQMKIGIYTVKEGPHSSVCYASIP